MIAQLSKLGWHRDGTDPVGIIGVRSCKDPHMKSLTNEQIAFYDLMVLREASLTPLGNAGMNLDLVAVTGGRPEVAPG